MADWYVYILKCNDGTLYTGITNNLERRLKAHEAGKGTKYTRGRGPFELIYKEYGMDRAQASRREALIRALSRSEKLSLGGAKFR